MNADPFEAALSSLLNLTLSVGRDPESWAGWQAGRLVIPSDAVFHHDSIGADPVYRVSDTEIFLIARTDVMYLPTNPGVQVVEVFDLYKDAKRFITCVQDRWMSHSPLWHLLLPDPDRSPVAPVADEESKPRVLLVEDDPVTRWLVRSALKGRCTFSTAATAGQVYSQYHALRPDLVFLDINLPDGSGHAVLQWIMREDYNANVVIFSGMSDFDNMTRALDEGAKGYIHKPFDQNHLLRFIARYPSRN